MQRSSRAMLRAVRFEVVVIGEPPQGSFIVPNHVSYMDIVALGSVSPQVFLAKSEVSVWPVIGSLTRMAGTLFIDRRRRRDVAAREESFSAVINAGLSMTIFLEGTSTNGEQVLPFRSSLLAPVVENGWPVTPAYLRYECEGADPRRDVCWWGDMGFSSHLWRLLGVKRTRATIVFGKPRQSGADRKVLAEELYRDVLELSRDCVSNSVK